MQKFDSITHFLATGGFRYRVFDMGRKVVHLSNQRFERIENQQEVYPYPFQQQAWLALLLWDKGGSNRDDAVIWFIHFPLDEMGYLQLQARDGFLLDLLEQAGKNIQARQQGEAVTDSLSESPFAFKPNPERQAMFHALATKELKQPPSRYCRHAVDYLKGRQGLDQWQFVGLQGVADLVARIDEADNQSLLADGLTRMPAPPALLFARMLEHIKPPAAVARSLRQRLGQLLENGNSKHEVELVSALLRGLSGDSENGATRRLISRVLESHYGQEIEVLAGISGRIWPVLEPDGLLVIFMQRLSQQEQSAFDVILADLMRIPGMRDKVMTVLRDPGRSNELSRKLTVFMSHIHGSDASIS